MAGLKVCVQADALTCGTFSTISYVVTMNNNADFYFYSSTEEDLPSEACVILTSRVGFILLYDN
jgi:hypothetical protein